MQHAVLLHRQVPGHFLDRHRVYCCCSCCCCMATNAQSVLLFHSGDFRTFPWLAVLRQMKYNLVRRMISSEHSEPVTFVTGGVDLVSDVKSCDVTWHLPLASCNKNVPQMLKHYERNAQSSAAWNICMFGHWWVLCPRHFLRRERSHLRIMTGLPSVCL